MVKIIIATTLIIFSISAMSSSGQGDNSPQFYETEVIYDGGGVNIEPYLPKKTRSSKTRMKKKFDARRRTKLVNAHFPVRTRAMTVGPVSNDEAAGVRYDIMERAIFIVGYDPVSINWLRKNRELLSEKKAIGMVVNVENEQQMNELQRIVGSSVIMQPTPGARLSEHMKINHYPFYMDSEGVLR